jgi:hypothetical protein
MALSGPQALSALDEALRDVRREEDDLARRLARSVELSVKLRQTEGELMRRLAAAMQEAEARAELTGSLTQAEVEARTLLDRHGPELEAAQSSLAALDQRIASLEGERARVRDASDKAEAALVALAERIEAAPQPDPARLAAREGAAAARLVASEAQKKARQAEADWALKGRPFRDDPLFTYLWDRGYGTPAYRHGGPTAALDGWVARLIGFERARASFALIGALPQRFRAFAEAVQQRANAAEAELGRLERAAIDAAGGKADRETLEHAAARISELDAEIVVIEDERDEAARRRRELAQGSQPPLSAALTALSGALEREDVRTLLRRGRAGGNEGLVRQVDELRGRAADEESDARDLRARLKTLALRRREIEDIRYEFKRHRFDEARSWLAEERLATDMLNDFLRGGIAAAEYWSRLRRSQKWSAEPAASTARRGFDWLGPAAARDEAPASRASVASSAGEEFSRPRNPEQAVAAKASANA